MALEGQCEASRPVPPTPVIPVSPGSVGGSGGSGEVFSQWAARLASFAFPWTGRSGTGLA